MGFATSERLEVVAERLEAAGFTAAIHDEAFGRMLLTVDPDGVEIWVNEDMTDLYGYQEVD